MFEVLAHPVVFCRQKGRVEDDAEGDGGVEEHVVDDNVEAVLEPEPEAVVETALATTGAVAVVVGLCKRARELLSGNL